MQGVACIKGEIHNVLTALRLTSANDSRNAFTSSETESELVRGLLELHASLAAVRSIRHMDTATFLAPFLAVLASEQVRTRTHWH